MTTNRMGLEQTLSDERLELFISQPLDNGLTRGEQMELAREALARRKASKDPVATQFKQVADLYEMQFDDGRTCAFHTDAAKAVQWLITCDGNKVQEYVKLERLQNALTDTKAVTVPDGWTDAQCLEFLTVAFRHNRIKGDIEFNDIRLGVKMANDYRPPKSVTNEP